MKFAITLAALAASAFAQRIEIGAPKNLAEVKAGSKITVEVDRPVRTPIFLVLRVSLTQARCMRLELPHWVDGSRYRDWPLALRRPEGHLQVRVDRRQPGSRQRRLHRVVQARVRQQGADEAATPELRDHRPVVVLQGPGQPGRRPSVLGGGKCFFSRLRS